MYVHRNLGNLVQGNDLNVQSVLEYAVAHLRVTDIIVAGALVNESNRHALVSQHIHILYNTWNTSKGRYDCGAVKAASSTKDLGILESWLRAIRDVYRQHTDYLDLLKVGVR